MFTNSKYLSLWKGKWNKPIFWGWLITSLEPFELMDGDCPEILNARIKWKTTKIRPWFQQLWDSFGGIGAFPTWIGSYISTDWANDHLIVAYNQSGTEYLVKVTADWVQTPITTSALITVEARTEFITIWWITYITNGTDLLGRYDGTAYTTWFWTQPASFRPGFIVLFDGCLWASWWSANTNIVYKTVKWDGEDYTWAWSDNFIFDENIVWLGATLQSIFYFTNTTVWVTDKNDIDTASWSPIYNQRPLVVKEWSVNHASIVSASKSVFYVTPTNKIKMISRNWEQFDAVDLSHAEYNWIEDIMDGLSANQEESFWYFLPWPNLIKWHFKSKGSSYNNVCIVYDLTHSVFLRDTQKFFYAWITHKSKYYTVSMIEDKVFRDEYSFDDDSTAIWFKRVSKDFTTGWITFKQELYQTRRYLSINRLAVLTEKIFLDWNLIHTSTFSNDNLPISQDWVWTYEIWTSEIWVDWDKTWTEEEFDISDVTEKSNLSVRWFKIKIVWECNIIWSRVTLKDYDIRTEALNELIS